MFDSVLLEMTAYSNILHILPNNLLASISPLRLVGYVGLCENRLHATAQHLMVHQLIISLFPYLSGGKMPYRWQVFRDEEAQVLLLVCDMPLALEETGMLVETGISAPQNGAFTHKMGMEPTNNW